MDSSRRVHIFDTTLRDGQQCPGAGMTFQENLDYAALVKLARVDVVEAGFPSASKVDFDIVHAIAELYGSDADSPTVAGLCQLRSEQIDQTIEALEPSIAKKKGRLHTYVPVDPGLMVASLGEKADKGQIREHVYEFTKRAVEAGLEVEFSPEGYSRAGENFDFTTDLIRAAIEGGARVINCPDTIGGASDLEGETYFVHSLNRHAEIIASEYPGREIIWSTHCHNDFGLAVQNSINAVFNGPCRQIEGCFNGVGERAGNAALESAIMIIKHFGPKRGDANGLYTNIDTSYLQQVCDFVSEKMLPRQPHWPVTGDNAAKHSSGGHTNAILNNPLAYQPFDPKEVGKEISLLFGPLSGGNHAKSIIEAQGYSCTEDEKAEVAQFIKNRFKERRKGITDQELMQGYFEYRQPISVHSINYSRSADKSAVELHGQVFEESGTIEEENQGRDSALAALKKLTDRHWPTRIQSHQSKSESAGVAAVSVSTIVLKDKFERIVEGRGEDQDIEISAMKALIDAVNRSYIDTHYKLT